MDAAGAPAIVVKAEVQDGASSQEGTPMKQAKVEAEALSQGGLVTAQARRVLAMSKGRMRVPLEDLGPALFNRQGQATCGKHCHDLAERILKVEGFATFRYDAGFCHEPDPENPLAVSAHGNRMADADGLLPRLPAKPLKGVFAKTHLVTFLQLLKWGHMPELSRLLAASSQGDSASSQEELQDVLQHGVFMHVFPWAAVRDHKDDIVALMASDNFDHAYGLAESELRCIKAMRSSILSLEVPPGRSQWDVVREHVARLAGQRWLEKDLAAFWDFAKTTLDLHLDLLLAVWTFAKCESVLKVDSGFFRSLARLPAKRQWTRAALAVAQFLSDRKSECSLVGGSYVAGAVSGGQLKKLASTSRSEEQKAWSQALENFLEAVMGRYYAPWASDPAAVPFGRDTWTRAMAGFLCRAGKIVAADRPLEEVAKSKLEDKLRKALLAGGLGAPLPDRVVPALSQDAEEAQTEPRVETETVRVSDGSGCAVVSLKRLATEAGLELGGRVLRKTAAKEAPPEVGIVKAIGEEKISVSWSGAAEEQHSVEELALAPKPKKEVAPSKALSEDGIKWALCSSAQNEEMLHHMAVTVLYQVYTSQASSQAELHLLGDEAGRGPVSVYARKEMKPGALMLVPFSPTVVEGGAARPANASPLEMLIKPDGEEAQPFPFWIKPKPLPKKFVKNQETAVALVPFWLLAFHPEPAAGAPSQDGAVGAPSQDGAVAPRSELVYKTGVVTVPTPAALTKGVRVTRADIKQRMLIMTNEGHIAKGDRLYVSAKPPAALEG